jgi:hypothetical protein
MKDINDYKLTTDTTVGQLREWMSVKDDKAKHSIIRLIYHRFNNRYIKHTKGADSGFLIMAICCLMLEALQSFKHGLNDTKGIGVRVFRRFFQEETRHFPGFSKIADDFYYNIRCGILHQAETKNAWRILLRSGKLLDDKEYSINATKFLDALEQSMNDYVETLRKSDFTSDCWRHVLTKLEDICSNCERTL